jgi:hypothetical protein
MRIHFLAIYRNRLSQSQTNSHCRSHSVPSLCIVAARFSKKGGDQMGTLLTLLFMVANALSSDTLAPTDQSASAGSVAVPTAPVSMRVKRNETGDIF